MPSLLLPSAVGVAGNPAHRGVTTGVAAPTNSVMLFAYKLSATQTSPEPSIAMSPLYCISPFVYPVEGESGIPALENSDTLPLKDTVFV